jgi:hypothetical protein
VEELAELSFLARMRGHLKHAHDHGFVSWSRKKLKWNLPGEDRWFSPTRHDKLLLGVTGIDTDF